MAAASCGNRDSSAVSTGSPAVSRRLLPVSSNAVRATVCPSRHTVTGRPSPRIPWAAAARKITVSSR